MSYCSFGSWANPAILIAVIWPNNELILSTSPLPTITCSPLFKILNLSPTFKLDLSIDVLTVKVAPDMSTWNLELVLYFQEFAKICLYELVYYILINR